jgi:hypothetical protein
MPPTTESLFPGLPASSTDPVPASSNGNHPAAARNGSEDLESEVLREVSALVARVKDAVEEKNWRAAAETVGLREIYLDGHPEDVEELLARVEASTRDLFDFEPILQRMVLSDVRPARARFTAHAKLVWHSTIDWRDHEMEQTVHLGFVKRNGAWVVSHLGFSAPPRVAPAPPEERREIQGSATSAALEAAEWRAPGPIHTEAQARSGAGQGGDATSGPSITEGSPPRLSERFLAQLATDYISSLSQPRSEPAAAATPAAPMASNGADSKHHVIFMPVIVPETLARQLLAAADGR